MKNQADNSPKRLAIRWKEFQVSSPFLSRIIKGISLLSMIAIGFIGILFLLVYLDFFGKVPSTQDLRHIQNSTASEIYSSDKVILGKYYLSLIHI